MAQRFTPKQFFSPSNPFFILGLPVVIAASCIADHDEPLDPTNSVAAPSSIEPLTDPASEPLAVRSLRQTFSDHADRVLGKTMPQGFVTTNKTFVREPMDAGLVHLNVELPRNSQEPIRFIAPGGHEIRVQPFGLQGDGELTDRAVTYHRPHGTSFWSITGGGAEEWLHFEAGAITSDLDVAAEWDIEGATPVMMNDAVALMDANGVARAWVTAPEAYGAEGRPVALRLSVEGRRIQLFADADGEEVLLDPGWAAVAPISSGCYGSSATVLPNGTALHAGGYNLVNILATTQLFNPATNTWSAGPNLNRGRYSASMALLHDGRVLLASGQSSIGHDPSIELYHPATNSWAYGAPMAVARTYTQAVLLADGRVLVAGGYIAGALFATSAEIYNPISNTWTSAGNMSTARAWHGAARLDDGRVLIAGGINNSVTMPNVLSSVEIYNPMTNSWSNAGNMLNPRYLFTLARLNSALFMAPGGIDSTGEGFAAAELYDPMTNSWTATMPLPNPMGAQSVAVLGSGHLLSASGYGIGMTNSTSAAYDPMTASWSNTGNVSVGRYFGATVTLDDGDALFISGTTNGMAVTNAVDRYDFGGLANGLSCTKSAICTSGFCVDGVCCDSACNAGACDACSTAAGATTNGVCELFTGNSCDDGNSCTQTDTCQAGACLGANPIVCTPSDSCHNPGVCNPGTGTCSNPAKIDGTLCDDGNGCTQTDTCQAGTCTGANPVVCFILSQCHTAGTCNPLTGACSNPRKPDGTVCDDGSACNTMDTCQSGACVGTNPTKCTAIDSCHDVGTCNPGTGICSNPLKIDGAACSDGNACTQVDTCLAGVCKGAMPTICTASDQCHTAGFCDAISGACTNPIKGNGTACNDGDACTKKDTCQTGVCTGANPVICAASDQCHDAGTCDSLTGMCSNPAKTDGATCDDNDKCTQMDTCIAGACTGADPLACSASDECHDIGSCDSFTGNCSNPAKTDGSPCTGGVCQGGTCQADPSTSSTGGGMGGQGGPGGAGGLGGNGGQGGVGASSSSESGNNSSSSVGGTGGSPLTEPGGCGCRTAGSKDSTNSSALAGLALAAIVMMRKRRTPSPSFID